MKLFFTLLLLVTCTAQAQQYEMVGPYEIVARDGMYRSSKSGWERDMKAAWDFSKKGQSQEARRIINAYSGRLKRIEGHDAPLCLIQGYWLCCAMTNIASYTSAKEKEEWNNMLRRAMLPVMHMFERNSPYSNGNWGAIVNRFRMAAAIAMHDSLMYRQSINYYLHGYDNGSLPHYISETGQCQETGRDQNHVQLGIGAMADICEMALTQGDDLWSALDNRLLKAFEYAAKYNLGYDVPFTTWNDCTGLYCNWTEPGKMGRGRIWDIYEKPYNHYVKVKGLKMPYAKKVLSLRDKAIRQGKINIGIETQTFQVTGLTDSFSHGKGVEKELHKLFVYPAPQGAPLKHDYDVYVKTREGNQWTKVDTYMAKVNASIGNKRHKVNEISFCLFDFTGDVFVRVVSKNRKFNTARIRPDYRGVIANVMNDSTVQFVLFQPENVSVEFDDDITNNLLLFTSKPPVTREEAETQAMHENRTFKYYAPGFYNVDTIKVASNTTIYLAGGSFFTGTFAVDGAQNVSIVGRGIARPPLGYEGAHVYRSKNVSIDGLVVNTCPIGGSNGVTLHDVRSISHPAWGDGLNVFASQNVFFDRVFCRNSDDCTTAYATRKGFSGNTRNIRMRNATLWADVAHPIFIGIHGNPAVGDTIENLIYENIDILGQAEPQVDYQGCLAINCGDGNMVRNVLFDNIRIEKIEEGCITQVKVGYNQKYCTAPGRSINNVTFRNVRYNLFSLGEEYVGMPNLSIINGYDSLRRVQGITFEGLKINGQYIYDGMSGKPQWYSTADYIPMFVGNHVSDIVFKSLGTGVFVKDEGSR